MSQGYGLGFESLGFDDEVDEEMDVEDEIPLWLDGSLIRNGPGMFDMGDEDESVEHWFDGLGMLRKFSFKDGTVKYSNRFVRGEAYREAKKGPISGFGTNSSQSLLKNIWKIVRGDSTDNANVNVAKIGGKYVALTEVPVEIGFDPDTLETQGEIDMGGPSGHITTAHPVYDPFRSETYNFVTKFSRRSVYRIYRHPDTGSRETIAEVEARDREPAYMHSFGLTQNYVVLTEFPFVVRPRDLLKPLSGKGAFIDQYRWIPEKGTRFVVIERETGEVISEEINDSFFCFHHVNAFEYEDRIIIDLVSFNDSSAIDSLYLSDLRREEVDPLGGKLKRYKLDLSNGEISNRTLYEGMSLPRMNAKRKTRKYRYVYAQGDQEEGFTNKIVKVDTKKEKSRTWEEQGSYVSEPVFVPHPSESDEDGDTDKGVVLAVALEAPKNQSSIVILDAENLEELGRARAPHSIPFDFHGMFFENVY